MFLLPPSLSNRRLRKSSGNSLLRRRMLLLLVTLIGTAGAYGAVYRCEDPDEPVLFSQFQCPPAHQQHTISPDAQNLIDIPALSATEKAALRRLQQDLADDRARAQMARSKARQQQAERIAARKVLCHEARNRLATLQARKRKGYRATDARKLAERGRELRRLRKANC